MKTVIDEQHRGFLFKKGKFIKMLEAGTYRTCCGKEIRLTADIRFSGCRSERIRV